MLKNERTQNPEILELRERLLYMTTEWVHDGSSPANFVRKTGMGAEVARVDRWCGGFQQPHRPITIGWQTSVGNSYQHGVVLVQYFNATTGEPVPAKKAIQLAIQEAKDLADAALEKLQNDRD